MEAWPPEFPVSLILRHILIHIFIILELGVCLTINDRVIHISLSFYFLVNHKIVACLTINDISDTVNYDALLLRELQVEFL